MRLGDTIAAISTPAGRGGIGIVRLSGPQARDVAAATLHLPEGQAWRPWTSFLARLPGPDGATVDQAVVSFFAAPRSYTAEDVVEVALHGAPVVLRHCLARAQEAGARLAEPGEFTLRAYLNGRLDLPQAEAVRDLIHATTLYQARIAAQQVDGAVSRRIAPVKTQLLELIALLEAGIDFAEDDISVASDAEILRRLGPIQEGVRALAGSFAYGRLVHDGVTLAIAGRPNAGKSSLFNRLLDQARAIVTEIAGTTRDLVSETAEMGGIPVKLIDTAGLRESTDTVERLGIARTHQAVADADVLLVVIDGSLPLEAEDERLMERARGQEGVIVWNKSDLAAATSPPQDAMPVSALTGEGMIRLREAILHAITRGAPHREEGFITSIRHEGLLRESLEYCEKARLAVASRIPHEMLLLDLYCALRPIDAITGATTADDILNRIFSTFCIGK